MKKYIGNVVSTSNLKLEKGLRRCISIEEVENALPTIIVGIDTAKASIPNFNILKKTYNKDNLWWTFARTERLYDYKNDMHMFYKHCVSTADRGVVYELVDIKKLGLSRARKLIKYINSSDKKYIYNDFDKFVFVYSPKYKRVWGFSLSTSEYMGLKKEKILKLLSSNPYNQFIPDFSSIPYVFRTILDNKIHKLMVLYDHFAL